MLIISLEIKKSIVEREIQKTIKEKQAKTERSKGSRSYSERVRPEWFCCTFKLGFFDLTCKVSLIFKSNLQLALSIFLKQRELYESKHVAVECRCFKLWDLLSFFYMFLNHSFKMMTCFVNAARTTASTGKFI